MKKVLWLIVCLMTMVLSVNAQKLTNSYSTIIRCEGAYLPCWGEERFSKTPCSVKIDFAYLDEHGSMLSLTLKNKGGECHSYFENASIYTLKDEDGKVIKICNNLDEDILMIYPTKKNVYRLVIYDSVIME